MEEESPPPSEDGDDTSNTIHAQYEWSHTLPSIAIPETIARATNCDPTELPPLYDAINPDAIDTLIDPNTPTQTGPARSISFQYAGYHVTIQSTGDIHVHPEPID